MSIPPKHTFLPLDEEEANLMKSIENDEWTTDSQEETQKFLSSMKESLEYYSKKTKPISLRFHYPVLAKLKEKAKETGVSYQTIVSLLAKQYVEGKISLKI